MALQSDNLGMTALGVIGHQGKPQLADGMHLRWSFRKDRGFPWHGYYLFRRESNDGEPYSFGETLITSGAIQNQPINNGVGVPLSRFTFKAEDEQDVHGIASGRFLVRLTNDRAPLNEPEIALAAEEFVRLDFVPWPAWRVRGKLFFPQAGSVTIKLKWNGRPGAGNQTVRTETIKGNAGQTVDFDLIEDAITQVEFSEGPAAIVGLTYNLVRKDAKGKWQFIAPFTYPYCLPVKHENYPCSVDNPIALAGNRVRYDDPDLWQQRFAGDPGPSDGMLHWLEKLVAGGPEGPNMASVMTAPGEIDAADQEHVPERERPRQSRQRVMDLLLMGTPHPAIAQMLGLYFVDPTAKESTKEKPKRYDYLIVADRNKAASNDPALVNALANWRNDPGEDVLFVMESLDLFNQLADGWVTFHHEVLRDHAKPTAEPQGLKAYSLPGSRVRDNRTGEIIHAQRPNTAGLRWDLDWSEDNVAAAHRPIRYEVWRSDIGAKKPKEPAADKFYQLITPSTISVSHISGVEGDAGFPSVLPPFRLFYQDRYRPDGWFAYKVRGIDLFGRYTGFSQPATWCEWGQEPDAFCIEEKHPFAIQLADQTPPPPPEAVRGWALDPRDPHVVRDDAYNNWRNQLEGSAAYGALTQAERNNLMGLRIEWKWSYPQIRMAGKLAGFNLYYHPGNQPPGMVMRDGVQVPDGTGTDPANWDRQLVTVLEKEYVLETVRPLGTGEDAGPWAQVRMLLAGETLTLPLTADPEWVRPGEMHALFEKTVGGQPRREICRITAVDIPARKVTLDRALDPIFNRAEVTIGILERHYKKFLPLPKGDFPGGIPDFEVSVEKPMAYSHVTATAVRALDAGDVEGKTGNADKIYRVFRERPPAPDVVIYDSDKVYATPADYYGKSRYDFRWPARPHYATHLFRALDSAVFQADRTARKAGNGIIPEPGDDPIWTSIDDANTQESVRAEFHALEINLQGIDQMREALPHYRSLSNNALRVLASLPTSDPAYQQLTIQPVAMPNRAEEQQQTDELPGNARNCYFYRAAYVDGVQNRGPMSPASVPVGLPKRFPPPEPKLFRVTAGAADPQAPGDRKITLVWQPGRDEFAEYRIYRTTDPDQSRDTRLMDLYHSVPEVENPDGNTRTWTDEDAPANTDHYYRIVSVDVYGNVSSASRAVRARSYDDSRPAPPEWQEPVADVGAGTVDLSWSSPDAALACLVERAPADEETWTARSGWLSRGSYAFTDQRDPEAPAHRYRLRVMDSRGKLNNSFVSQLID